MPAWCWQRGLCTCRSKRPAYQNRPLGSMLCIALLTIQPRRRVAFVLLILFRNPRGNLNIQTSRYQEFIGRHCMQEACESCELGVSPGLTKRLVVERCVGSTAYAPCLGSLDSHSSLTHLPLAISCHHLPLPSSNWLTLRRDSPSCLPVPPAFL